MHDSQRAEPMELIAGKSYLVLGAFAENFGHDFIRVSKQYTCIDLFLPSWCESCITASGFGPFT